MKKKKKIRTGYVGTLFKGTWAETNVIVSDNVRPDNTLTVIDKGGEHVYTWNNRGA